MAKFYLIRHGKPDYTYGDTHGFIGQGHDLAPLKTERIEEVIEMAKDKLLYLLHIQEHYKQQVLYQRKLELILWSNQI